MTDSYLRRTVLALAGGLLAGTATASADHDSCTDSCGSDELAPSVKCDHECDHDGLSRIVAQSHDDRQCKVFVSTTEETFDLQVGSHDRVASDFGGQMRRLEIEDGDVDVVIKQRTNKHEEDH